MNFLSFASQCNCIKLPSKASPDSPTGNSDGSEHVDRAGFITQTGKRFLEYYVIGNVLENGQGKHGEIRRCKNKKTGEVREVKIINKNTLSDDEYEAFESDLEKIKVM